MKLATSFGYFYFFVIKFFSFFKFSPQILCIFVINHFAEHIVEAKIDVPQIIHVIEHRVAQMFDVIVVHPNEFQFFIVAQVLVSQERQAVVIQRQISQFDEIFKRQFRNYCQFIVAEMQRAKFLMVFERVDVNFVNFIKFQS